jgi:hypothetical protein
MHPLDIRRFAGFALLAGAVVLTPLRSSGAGRRGYPNPPSMPRKKERGRQAPFTIVRPIDGAKVRETMHILVPLGSIPAAGKVGMFIDGKFFGWLPFTTRGKYLDGTLDTTQLPDSEPGRSYKLELVLYVLSDGPARIISQSSVEIRISNQGSIPLPESGIKLRYSFSHRENFNWQHEGSIALTDPAPFEGRPLGLEIPDPAVPIAVSVEPVNSYPNGDAVVDITTTQEGTRVGLETVRLTPTGQLVFNARSTSELYSLILPVLPVRAIHPGDAWPSRIGGYPARGEFVGAEWKAAHPCAKIRQAIESGSLVQFLPGRGGKDYLGGMSAGCELIFWFALDTHELVRVERRIKTYQGGGGESGSQGNLLSVAVDMSDIVTAVL